MQYLTRLLFLICINLDSFFSLLQIEAQVLKTFKYGNTFVDDQRTESTRLKHLYVEDYVCNRLWDAYYIGGWRSFWRCSNCTRRSHLQLQQLVRLFRSLSLSIFFSVPPLKLLLSISPSHLEKAATEPNGKGEEKCIDDEDENEGTDQKEGPEPLTGTFHNMYH